MNSLGRALPALDTRRTPSSEGVLVDRWTLEKVLRRGGSVRGLSVHPLFGDTSRDPMPESRLHLTAAEDSG